MDGQAQTNMPPQLLRSWGHKKRKKKNTFYYLDSDLCLQFLTSIELSLCQLLSFIFLPVLNYIDSIRSTDKVDVIPGSLALQAIQCCSTLQKKKKKKNLGKLKIPCLSSDHSEVCRSKERHGSDCGKKA